MSEMRDYKGKVQRVVGSALWFGESGVPFIASEYGGLSVPVKSGDTVIFKYKTAKGKEGTIHQGKEFNNIVGGSLEIVAKDVTTNYSQTGFHHETNSFPSDRDTHIVRQNVLNRAIELVCASKIDLTQWKEFAEEFEKWVFR